MKRLLLLAPLVLLTSCSTGSKIKQLSCTYESVLGDTYGDAPKTDVFIFDSSTGEAFEYSDFYEKVELVEGVTTDEHGWELTYKSVIVNDVLKINSSYTDKNSFDFTEDPDTFKTRINLKELTVESEY